MIPDFESVCNALPGLTSAQRKELVFRCSQLGSAGPKAAEDAFAPETLLWGGIVSALEEQNMLCPPATLVSRLRGWGAFVRASRELLPWIRKHFDPQDMVETVRSFKIVAECILRVVKEMGVPATPTVLLRQARNATQAVEHAYPGYVASGFLRRWVLLAH